MSYEISGFDHTADKGIHVRADRLEELFRGAAIGMFGTMYVLDGLVVQRERSVAVSAVDLESLMVAWLQELIFLFEVEEELYTEVQVQELTETALRATVRGRSLGPEVRQIGAAVKAVTYHGLSLQRTLDGWEATLLFDV
jgi:SHS2 domain-containing protein